LLIIGIITAHVTTREDKIRIMFKHGFVVVIPRGGDEDKPAL
jgi:hypothetical protein